jgi:3-hydroxy-9,10-secoandrosta-1,3,5(10)-triene-9,17-dione monooxygenase
MLEVAGASASPAVTREELLRRAESLIPVLRERSQESETLRCCPAESVSDFIANGLLRISQPARYGGYEQDYDVLCEVVQTLARGCGSQAWVHMVFADNTLKLAAYSAQAQQDVWGKDRNAKLSNAVNPVGRGKPVAGGVRWSGKHQFSSGVDHADWVMAAGHIEHADRKQACSVMVPRSVLSIF